MTRSLLSFFVVFVLVLAVLFTSLFPFAGLKYSEEDDITVDGHVLHSSPPGLFVPSWALTRGESSEWSEDMQLTSGGGPGILDPHIAVEGDTVHLVWENYNDNQIWHRRSLDQGATWDIPRRVSNAPPGEFAMCPYVVANGSNVYVFWVDSRDSLKVYMGKSMDNGETWTAADKRISSFHESIVIGTPKAAIWGDTIYVFWTDDYFWYEGKAPEVFFSKSLDCGESWTTPSHVTDNDDSMSGVAEVCVYENTVHLAFVEERDPKLETYYKRSDDGGNTWTEDILVSTRDTYNSIAGSGMSMACDGTTLHMVMQEWRDAPGLEIYYSRSTDNGDTWAEPTRLSKNDDYNNTIGAIAADNGRVFAVWDDAEYNNICYRISGDGGETWTEIKELMSPPETGVLPVPAIKNEMMHVIFVANRSGSLEIYYKRSPPLPFVVTGIQLNLGWNCIGLPAQPPQGWTVSDFVESIEADTDFLVLAVSTWNSSVGRWQDFCYRDGSSFEHIRGEEGLGYVPIASELCYLVLLYAEEPSDMVWTLPAGFTNYTTRTAPGWSLSRGWNSVSLPYPSMGYMDTSTEILALDPCIIAVADWNETAQTWMVDNGTNPLPLYNWNNQNLKKTWNYNGLWILTTANWSVIPPITEDWSDETLLTDPGDIYQHSMVDVASWGDYVHVVCRTRWESTPNVYSCIQYLRSADGGATWNGPRNISDSSRRAWRPSVATYENHVYVTYTDNRDGDGPEIYMNISHDYGASWTGEFNVSAVNTHWADWSHVAAEENRVVVVWSEDRYNEYRVMYMRVSLDYGATWGEEKLLTDPNHIVEGYSESPAQVIISNETLYLLFDQGSPYTSRFEAMFMKSTDLGQTWATPTMLSPLDNWHSYSCSVALDGNRISAVWEDADCELYLSRSLDGGDSWLQKQRLTNYPGTSDSGMLAVGVGGEFFMSFCDDRSGSLEAWFMKSSNYGETWEPEYRLTEGTVYNGEAKLVYSQGKLNLIYVSERTGNSELYQMHSPAQ